MLAGVSMCDCAPGAMNQVTAFASNVQFVASV